eukprot:CAMPEP_0182428170 /NCGR_PEP_ID=MMETSP1167-20130531/21212_1 /TAXON_ID=2988 /ORGANISM="Mallomonas Sp, Strain CCMP3275" /LENGTH=111 /DNA_ID=CAMNT_0024610895 /DNA_START=723 /DNA_END=1058 /DNA_ORIENTATION=-
MTGTIPASLGDMKKLKVLHLDNNYLSGTIPVTLCRRKLSALYLFWVGNGDKGNEGLLCYPGCLTGVFDKKYGKLPICSYIHEPEMKKLAERPRAHNNCGNGTDGQQGCTLD